MERIEGDVHQNLKQSEESPHQKSKPVDDGWGEENAGWDDFPKQEKAEEKDQVDFK